MESFPEETVVMDARVGIEVGVQGKSAAMNADGVLDEEDMSRRERAAVEMKELADAATMAQKFGWWNVVEGAVLQQNSSNFYAYKSPQNAAQRWLRLEKKAAKVGKGLSKNKKARKLALKNWLEAVDPKHRYSHNLHFYCEAWGSSQTHEPFFYWLDVGEGKNLDLAKCKRSTLQKELIRYMSPNEREWFEVVIENGKLIYKMRREPVNTPKGDKWIFVMSTTGKLYVGKKEKGKLQHSSFLAGGATTAAGRLLVKDGTIELMEAHSGHYHPTRKNFDQLISILTSSGADLTLARVQAVSDDMRRSNSTESLRVNSEIGELDSLLVLEDVQKERLNDDDASIRELACLRLNDEEPTSGMADKVTLVEKTRPREAQDKDHVVIEGLQFLQRGNSFDGSGIWENVEVESIKPDKAFQPESQIPDEREVSTTGEDATTRSSFKLPPASVSPNELFAPASQTFSKLEDSGDSCSTDWQDARTGNTAQLTNDSKVYLLRRLSFKGPVVTPSSISRF